MTSEELILQIVDFYKETLSSQKTIDKFKDTLIVKVKVVEEMDKIRIDPNVILSAVSKVTQIPIDKIQSSARQPDKVIARQIYCVLSGKYTALNQFDRSLLIKKDRTSLVNLIRNHEKAEFRRKNGELDTYDQKYFNLYDLAEDKLKRYGASN